MKSDATRLEDRPAATKETMNAEIKRNQEAERVEQEYVALRSLVDAKLRQVLDLKLAFSNLEFKIGKAVEEFDAEVEAIRGNYSQK